MAPKREKNMAAVVHGIEDFRVEEIPMPTPLDNEVLLRMDCVGICGSDVHYISHGGFGDYKLKEPLVLGHESSGVVTAVGRHVTHLQVGDRVAIEPAIGCRACRHCKVGRYNLCPKGIYCATTGQGNLCNYYTHPADCCFKLPPNVTMEEGALLEPLAVAVHCCRRAGVRLGSTVLILGAGPIGLVTVLVAKAMGAGRICSVDLMESKLKLAKELGADATLAVSGHDSEEELVRRIHLLLLGEAPDISIECTGAEACVRLGIAATVAGGVMMLVGIGAINQRLPITTALVREIDILSSFRYANCYPAALALVANGTIDARKLITHHYDLSESVEAFKTSRYGLDGAIKVMIHCQPRNANNPERKF
ncbi:sorbitol dehydrogenase-like [Anopheles aquasalis]|uniref:sorbitol dehydrogenase-like n=1 Tax=Anopheles aquasalis TaxID=42839 RepID=UPI00215A20AD|nr:sorbitol dehydrogenase-like [Anopheles aquasalis]